MFKFVRSIIEPLRNTMLYQSRLGSGRKVSVIVQDDVLGPCCLILKFERKIEPSDVVNGKLLPNSSEEIKRRGGKRLTSIYIRHESAEALYLVLKSALKDARKRRLWHRLSRLIMASFFFEKSDHGLSK